MSEINVAIIQSELAWHDPQVNREMFTEKLSQVGPSDLVVLPEMLTTGFTMASSEFAETMDGPTIEWLHQQANKHQFAICGSLIVKDGDEFFNRFVLVEPNNVSEYRYDKRHLFRMAGEHQHFDSGVDRLIIEINGFRICPQICYDLRFPVFSRNRGDYDLLLFVANWPAARQQHWRTLLTARAIENQCFVIAANRIGLDGNDIDYSGDSGVIAPDGSWVLDMKNRNTTSTFTLDKKTLEDFRDQFPAWRDADTFTLT